MATISTLGAGSGLDLAGIVSSLMTVEAQPLAALQKKEASFQSRISSLGSLKSTLSSLKTAAEALIPSTGQTAANKYASFKASVADTAIAGASASTGAVSGNYSLEVSSLAKAHRLTTPTTADALGKAALDAGLLAGGSLSIDLGKLDGSTFTADSTRSLSVTVAPGATLAEVRDAINAKATDGRVSATIVNGTNGQQLVLSSAKTGNANVIKLSGISGLDFDPATASGTLSQDAAKGGQAASDAAFNLNGIAATSSTNTVSDVLDGVTLTLQKTNIGAPTTLTVTKDSTTNLTASINAFVTAYNDAAKATRTLGAYNSETKEAGALQGDSSLRGAQTQLRTLLQTAAGGSSAYQTLSNIGVELQKDGTLKLDSTKLNNAVAADYAGVTTLVEKAGSVFKAGLENLVGTSGSITAATDSTNRMIKETQKRQEALSLRLTQIEARYTKQFASLDTLVAGMNQTSSWLTAQLANLPGSSNSN